jgi:hypothetical protein
MVDACATPEERKAAIAASVKPACLVLDFCGNAGRHKLVTSADILGGKMSQDVRDRAMLNARNAEKARRMSELLTEAERDIQREREEREREERQRAEAARKARLVARASYSVQSINPFDVFQITPQAGSPYGNGAALSEKQSEILRKQGIDPSSMPFVQAKQLLNEIFRRWDGSLATLKQCKLLKKHGYDTKDLKMADASKLIGALAKNGWRRLDTPAARPAMALAVVEDAPY